MLEKAGRFARYRFLTSAAEMAPVVARFWGQEGLSAAWRALAEIGARWP